MQWTGPPDGVETTALITAYARAQETRRPDRLFTDSKAAAFVEAAAGAAITGSGRLPRLGPARDDGSSALWTSLGTYFTVRTPFYDNALIAAAAAGCRQAVILGAGMDARAYRFTLGPSMTIFEIDTAPVLQFKQAVLDATGDPPSTRRVGVAADLRDDWASALQACGFMATAPTVWLAEGLLIYLNAQQADELLTTITAQSAPGSRFAGEYLNRPPRMSDVALDDPGDIAVARVFVNAANTGPVDDPEPWLHRHEWTGKGRNFLTEITSHSRPVPQLFDPAKSDPLTLWLVSAALTANHAAHGAD
ncbi:SAM-dependent methyltransferase [Actinoplanes sp. Pm04-4]|uniref:S-adenosyl-L-methionine-dependent methyltransferase n=1 Tax=Paractinoplanes pyxinae TaxID=2997416 RepID=A0ABT4B4L5_9ACTN|nr:SAM-dependent methyltransferase [Actinoplanes pyxinae]MCY1141439.1 SAM-dependent methyltransferase [Actinoplanes pyxinae]